MTPEERRKIKGWLKKEPRGAFCQMPEYLQRHVEKKAVKVAIKNHQAISVYLRKIGVPQSIIDEINEKVEKKRIEKEKGNEVPIITGGGEDDEEVAKEQTKEEERGTPAYA